MKEDTYQVNYLSQQQQHKHVGGFILVFPRCDMN